MYEQDNTTKTCACINAIANSKPEKAIMKAKGNNPKKKKIIPELIMLYAKPLNIFNNICPDRIFAASLNPSETFLAKYEMNSIKTSNGNNAKGQPDGTNREKNFNPCLFNPNIVAPKTIVKLNEKVKMKWLVGAKLYGTKPIKLFININRNNTYIKGKYAWPAFPFIWFVTILCTVAYIDSWPIDHVLDISLLLLLDIKLTVKTK